eukprot:10428379-Alexandrium_andersonii.AAC.1
MCIRDRPDAGRGGRAARTPSAVLGRATTGATLRRQRARLICRRGRRVLAGRFGVLNDAASRSSAP